MFNGVMRLYLKRFIKTRKLFSFFTYFWGMVNFTAQLYIDWQRFSRHEKNDDASETRDNSRKRIHEKTRKNET